MQNFTQYSDLLTPSAVGSDVDKINPFFSSGDTKSFDDDDELSFNTKSPITEHEHEADMNNICSLSIDLPTLIELIDSNDSLNIFLDNSNANQLSEGADGTTMLKDDLAYPDSMPVEHECVIGANDNDDVFDSFSPSTSSTSSTTLRPERATAKKNLTSSERKQRKKDQNKNAAERYRLKKRQEKEELDSRFEDLKKKNTDLKIEYETKKYQLEHFKQLFVEILQMHDCKNGTD